MSARTLTNTAISITNAAITTEVLSGRQNWRSFVSLGKAPAPLGETWDRQGISMLIKDAMASFTARTGHQLPWNLDNQGSWRPFAWGRKHLRPEGRLIPQPTPRNAALEVAFMEARGLTGLWEPVVVMIPPTSYQDVPDPVEEAARLAGFIRHAADFPTLTRLIKKTTSARGVGSPRTTMDVASVARRWTPGAAERQLRKVMARANEILSPMGLSVSWQALGWVLEAGPKPVGKAALVAASATLRGGSYGACTYKDARNWMADNCRTIHSVEATEDGITSFGPAEPALEKGGFRVWKQTWNATKPSRREAGWLVTSPSNESYHALTPRNLTRYCQTLQAWVEVDPARAALEEAIRAFKQRRKAESEAGLPRNVTVLVTREDSWESGNCRPGTARFAADRGWDKRWYVPAEWLVRSGNRLAANAAKTAARKVRAIM
jgi:hypothetical protein